MSRRHPTPLAALAAALVLASTAHASGIVSSDSTTFLLRNDGDQAVTDAFALVEPPGKIQAASNTPSDPAALPFLIGPLTVLDDSGLERSKLVVSQLDGDKDGPKQVLALNFGGSGLQPGGHLQFGLAVDPAFDGTLALQLVDVQTLAPLTTGGLSLVPVPPVPAEGPDPGDQDGGPTGGAEPPPTGPETQVPEPLTLVLWSTGAVALGLARARAYRRARPPSV